MIFPGRQRSIEIYHSKSNCVYDKVFVERIFLMACTVFNRVNRGLLVRWATWKRDEAGYQPSHAPHFCSPRTIIWKVIRWNGRNLKQVRPVLMVAFLTFYPGICRGVRRGIFAGLTQPVPRLKLYLNHSRRIFGCAGGFDGQNWNWKNFLVVWPGQFKSMDKKPTVVIEALADGEHCICGFNFNEPGSLNDINI